MARAHRVKNRIREIRKEKGLSQEQLAEKVGVHFTTIAKIERAERGLSTDMLAAVSRALGVPPIAILEKPSDAMTSIRQVPLLGRIPAGNWREAIHDPDGFIAVPAAGEDAFGLRVEGDSMDKIVGPGAIVVVDPSDTELRNGSVYAILNGEGESTFKRFRTDPMRLEPVSNNPAHKEYPLGQVPFTVIGRVVWQVSPL